MSRGKGTSGGKKGKSGLGEEDFHLWKAFTRDITPFHSTPDEDGDEAFLCINQPPPKPLAPSREKPVRPSPSKMSEPQSAELDLRTELRLRRGKMPIEGRLDLHGCTQDKAHRLLETFLLSAHAQGKRCVLVITGKGKTARQIEDGEAAVGVLRQKLPQWLAMPPLRGVVLKALPAVPKDGGTGAWYVYLRRQRD